VVQHGINGLLTDFFDARALADKVIEALVSPELMWGLRKAARDSVVQRFGLAAGEAAYRALLSGPTPP
jgi:glycosyltransferase involved in cell wall biosynthesis